MQLLVHLQVSLAVQKEPYFDMASHLGVISLLQTHEVLRECPWRLVSVVPAIVLSIVHVIVHVRSASAYLIVSEVMRFVSAVL